MADRGEVAGRTPRRHETRRAGGILRGEAAGGPGSTRHQPCRWLDRRRQRGGGARPWRPQGRGVG
ncbi:putative pollen-specific leucine-rich repeat extensin-like protein 3 [Iris pallida]|uniref:Pollen-specific leucine-rich repeat extensin-like protein 3 n=1 Tax=Iris pallida TaxID=29817 RepID=A0AAX6E4Y7_IRIPA|nr:putative pollen-specific leucine-rich repeat extensin-like protein 3 [Iris pallida]